MAHTTKRPDIPVADQILNKEEYPLTVLGEILPPAILPGLVKYKANRAAIDDKFMKASAAISQIKKVETDQDDEIATKMIVKCTATVDSMEKLRKEYSGIINAFLKDEIQSENKLKVMIADLRAMRDKRASGLKAEADKKQAEINAQVERDKLIIEIKRLIKDAVENGIFDRVTAFDNVLNDKVKTVLTIENQAAFTAQLKAIKPKMKKEVYDALFVLDPLTTKLKYTHADYAEAVAPAKAHFTYEKVDGNYEGMASSVLNSWITKIPARVQELKRLAAGGEAAEKLKQQIADREKAEAQDLANIAEKNRQAAQLKNATEAQNESLSADFKGQVQTQSIEQPKGTRETIYYTLEPGVSLVKIAQIVSSIIMNMVSTADAQIEQVFKTRSDKPEEIEYVDGIQYWLNQVPKLGYKPNIDGLKTNTKITTIAKK